MVCCGIMAIRRKHNGYSDHDEFGRPTGADGGAVDMAIRLLREQKAELEKLRAAQEEQ